MLVAKGYGTLCRCLAAKANSSQFHGRIIKKYSFPGSTPREFNSVNLGRMRVEAWRLNCKQASQMILRESVHGQVFGSHRLIQVHRQPLPFLCTWQRTSPDHCAHSRLGPRILLGACSDHQPFGGGIKTKPICPLQPRVSRKGTGEVESYARPLTQQRRRITGCFCASGSFLLCQGVMVRELLFFSPKRVDSYL